MAHKAKDANKNSLQTKAKIRSALFKLIEEKGAIESVTVKEVCEEAGIQRSTFYIHFNDIFDVMDTTLDIFYGRMVSFVPKKICGSHDAQGFFDSLFAFLEIHQKEISRAFKGKRALAIIMNSEKQLMEAFDKALEKGGIKVNKARSFVVFNGLYSLVYEILMGIVPLTLEDAREEANFIGKRMFVE